MNNLSNDKGRAPGTLLKHCTASILRVCAAISISLILRVPAGIALGVNKTCSRLFSPLLYFIYPIPKVAFLPVLMLLFGLGNSSEDFCRVKNQHRDILGLNGNITVVWGGKGVDGHIHTGFFEETLFYSKYYGNS